MAQATNTTAREEPLQSNQSARSSERHDRSAMSLVGRSKPVLPSGPSDPSAMGTAAAAAANTASSKPRPFLDGIFRASCNYCVSSSKRGCSGGEPCDQCFKRGKVCVYSARRKSGPRGRPVSAARLSKYRPRAKVRRESIAGAAAATASPATAGAAASPALEPSSSQRGEAVRQVSWTGYGNGDLSAAAADDDDEKNTENAFIWEQRTLSFPQEPHQEQEQEQQRHHHKQQQEPIEPVTEPYRGPGDDWQPLPLEAQHPVTSMPRRDAPGPIRSHRRIEYSPPWDAEVGHQLQTSSPPAPVLPLRSVSAAAAEAGGVREVDGHGRGHGSKPLSRASSEDPAGNNKRTRLSLTPLPQFPRASTPGGLPLSLPPPRSSSPARPPHIVSTTLHSSSASSSSLSWQSSSSSSSSSTSSEGTGVGLMSRWLSPSRSSSSSRSTYWTPAPFSGRTGPGVVPVEVASAAPVSAWDVIRENEVPAETAKGVAPPIAKGVLDRVRSFSRFGGGGGGGGGSGVTEGPLAASGWTGIATMAASCVDEGRDEDELETSFGSTFSTEKQEEPRLQLNLKVQQLQLEKKEWQLRQWQEQLELQQQQQQQQEEEEDGRSSTNWQLSLGALLMGDDDDEEEVGSSPSIGAGGARV